MNPPPVDTAPGPGPSAAGVPPALPHSGIPVTAEQRCILNHLQAHPVTVVSAGAGAGKTYTTVAAVVELIAGDRAQADEFVLITFTNQAADELRSRLQQALVAQARDATQVARRGYWLEQRERLSAAFIGTIHGFCKQLLDLYGYGQGVAREASVSMSRRLRKTAVEALALRLLQPNDAADPVAALVLQEGWETHKLCRWLEDMFCGARNQGLDLGVMLEATRGQPEDAGKALRVRCAELLVELERDYEAACRAEHQLDAAALLLEAAALLDSADGQGVIERIAGRFHYLFIDEFQDTSLTQARIASALASRLTTVVVGDRKQAIYAFAGANQRLLADFAQRHGTTPLPLSLSGRPSRPLLAVQTVLFRSMKERFPDLDEPLQPSERNLDPTDGLPPCVTLLTDTDKADALASAVARITGLLRISMDRGPQAGTTRVEPGDIAVLVRTNGEVAQWVDALVAGGVPARSDAGTPLLRRPEVVSMYRFLQLLSRYPDDIALAEALPTPFFEDVDLADEEARILSFGVQRGQPLTQAFEQHYSEHAEQLHHLRVESLSATVPQLLGLVEQAFGLKAAYRGAGNEAAALALDRLRDYARSRFDSDQALTLRTFLEMLRRDIMNDVDLPEPASREQGRPPYVRVMTIHRAKGLEFPIVVIPNLEADRAGAKHLPYMLDLEEGLEVNVKTAAGWTASRQYWERLKAQCGQALAEEMRLFYVAVTRAERMLLLLGCEADGGEGACSWQQEVLAARDAMRGAGAKFGRLEAP